MILSITLAVLFYTSHQFRFSFDQNLTFLTEKFHLTCLQLQPSDLFFSNEWQALVCAKNLPTSENKKIFLNTGLIHLFVVSGAHLVRLDQLLQSGLQKIKSFKNKFLIWFLLLIFTLACQAQPPILRSFIGLTLAFLLLNRAASITQPTIILFSGLITLILNPQWVLSLSLQMSWLMALVISTPFTSHKTTSFLYSTLFGWLILWPTLTYFTNPSLSTMVTNLLFSTFLELFLFPLALLAIVSDTAAVIFDCSMQELIFILRYFQTTEGRSLPLDKTTLLNLNWFLILGLHTVLEIKKLIHQKRTSQ